MLHETKVHRFIAILH